MPPLTPEQRRLRAQIAAHTKWADTDRVAGTAAARAAFLARFEANVDPDGTLPPAERLRRAENAMRAHMARLSFLSARSRARRRGTT